MTTIKDFKAWLQTKNPEEEYCYVSNGDCCFAQFLKETGVCKNPCVGPWDWSKKGDIKFYKIPEKIQEAIHPVDEGTSSTYGAALERLG